jgi:hypothetical protein
MAMSAPPPSVQPVKPEPVTVIPLEIVQTFSADPQALQAASEADPGLL